MFRHIALAAALTFVAFNASAGVASRIILFEDIKPKGAVITSAFESIGLDAQERVYATLCNPSPTAGDCYLFRWDPKTGKRQYLGSLVKTARAVGNIGPNKFWKRKEVIVKGHTHNVFLDGQIWMGTMGAHGYEPGTVHRGVHIFGFNLGNGRLVDHSQWQPKGVFKPNTGMFALAEHHDRNLLVGIGPVDCEIITYNPRTRETHRIPGVPKENNPQLSGRDMAVVGDKVIYQCGSAKTPLSIYNLDTKENRTVDFPGDAVLTLGYVPTKDGKTVYISDQKTIYALDMATEKFSKVVDFDPNGVPRQVSPPFMSLDEKKLYWIINLTEVNGGAYINDLWEYDLATGTRTKLGNLKKVLRGGAKVSGTKATASNGKIYMVFNSARAGILELAIAP